MIFQELFPAIRSNLLLFKEKSKRISATIGARAPAFGGKFERKEHIWEGEKEKLVVSAPFPD
jgi:hypothetical protein